MNKHRVIFVLCAWATVDSLAFVSPCRAEQEPQSLPPADAAKSLDNRGYLSDTDAGYRLLERMQRHAAENAVGPTIEQVLAEIEHLQSVGYIDRCPECDVWLQTGRSNTRYEDPLFSATIHDILSRLHSIGMRLGMPVGEAPIIGTLQVEGVNARRVKSPGADRAILVINSRVYDFVWSFAKTLAAATPTGIDAEGRTFFRMNREETRGRVTEIPLIVQVVANEMCWYVHGSRPRVGLSLQQLDESRQIIATTLLDSIEMFIVGHEFGHDIRNHRPIRVSHLNLISDPDPSAERESVEVDLASEQIFSWRQEFEADIMGLFLVANEREQRENLQIRAWCADIFLAIAQFEQDARHVATTGRRFDRSISPEEYQRGVGLVLAILKPEDGVAPELTPEQIEYMKSFGSITHPPHWMRRIAVRMAMRRYGYWPEGAPDIGKMYEEVLDAAWPMTQERMLDKTPEPWWDEEELVPNPLRSK